jgi:hypothetical protein
MTKNVEIGGDSLREARFTNLAKMGRLASVSPTAAI